MLRVEENLMQSLFAFFVVGDLKRIAFFYLLFGYPTANFGQLSRGQHLLPDVNNHVLIFLNCRLPGAMHRGWVSKHGQLPSGV